MRTNATKLLTLPRIYIVSNKRNSHATSACGMDDASCLYWGWVAQVWAGGRGLRVIVLGGSGVRACRL